MGLDDPQSINYEPNDTLTTRVRTFISFYISNNDRVASAKAAGFYGDKAMLDDLTIKLLGRPIVHIEIRKRWAMQLVRADITHTRIVNELACIAFFDPAEMFDQHGGYLPIHKMPERARRALHVMASGVNVSGVKVFSKEKALEMLGNYLGMFKNINGVPQGSEPVPSLAAFDLDERAKQIRESLKLLDPPASTETKDNTLDEILA